MKITVELKSLVAKGRDKFPLELPDDIGVEQAIAYIIAARPEMNEKVRFMFLINKELVVSNQQLRENDVLTVFPPLMGG